MFSAKEKTYIALFGDNKLEGLQLILYGLIRRIKILVITPLASLSYIAILKRIFFIRKCLESSIKEYDAFSDDSALERMRDSLYELTVSKR